MTMMAMAIPYRIGADALSHLDVSRPRAACGVQLVTTGILRGPGHGAMRPRMPDAELQSRPHDTCPDQAGPRCAQLTTIKTLPSSPLASGQSTMRRRPTS